MQALALLTEVVRRRRTTPRRLHGELTRRTNLRHHAWLLAVLEDAAAGVHSVLERSFRHRVLARHGMPAGESQWRETTEDGVVYRDVVLRRYSVILELDGRLGHEESRDGWDDMDRDLLAAARDR